MPNNMSDECKAIVDFLNCDYELLSDGEALISRFNELAAQGKAGGFFPLIIIPSDTLVEMLELTAEVNSMENTPQGIEAYRHKVLEAARGIDAAQLLSAQLDESLKGFEGYDVLGQFEQAEPLNDFALYSLQGEAIIAKIPADHPWELAAWLPMGGFNDCPSPERQAAIFRYWHDTYGAVPALVTHDIWQMTVAQPPSADEASLVLAKEHFAFCPDIVLQGTESIRALASSLTDSSMWYFWWD